MSKLLRVCSSCKHYPEDEYCKECIYKFTIHGNTELEPSEEFTNKPCVSEQTCHDDKVKVLSKIRAEIENDWQLKEFPSSSPFSCGLRRAIEIIDKYMKEIEDKE